MNITILRGSSEVRVSIDCSSLVEDQAYGSGIGHRGTLDYIYETIHALGDYYHISRQDFPAVTGNVYESRLVLAHDVPKSAQPMGLTPPIFLST